MYMKRGIYETIAMHREAILSLWQAAAMPHAQQALRIGAAKPAVSAASSYVLKKDTEALFDWLISQDDAPLAPSAPASLREMCKLRAVQTAAPSEALDFIVELKRIIRLVLSHDEIDSAQLGALYDFDTRVDQLLLLAFDAYSACREQIMNIKLDELRRAGTMQRGVQ
jgi:predicted RNA-binding Zn ribbon-like protein